MTLLKAALGLALAGTALAWSPAFLASYTLPKLALLSAAVLLAGSALGRRACPAPRGSSVDAPLAAFLAATAVSVLFSRDPIVSLFGHFNSNLHGLWPTMLLCAVFFAARALPAEAVWGLLRFSLGAGAAVGAYALLQAASLEPFPSAGRLPGGRAISSIGGPVYLGAHLAPLFPLALHCALRERRGRAFGWAAMALVAGGLGAAATRGAWLGAAAGAAAYVALAGRIPLAALSRGRRAALGVAAALIVAAGASRMAGRVGSWRGSYRAVMLRAAWDVWRAAPLLGGGPDTFELDFRAHKTLEAVRSIHNAVEFQIHAHNDIAQVAATTGLAGLAAYLWLMFALGAAWWTGRESGPSDGRADAAACALLALAVPLKLNPLAIGAAVEAALLAAFLAGDGGGGGGEVRRRWAAASLLVLGLFSTAASGRLLAADREARLGAVLDAFGHPAEARPHLERAARLNPCELEYRQLLVNHYIEAAYKGREVPAEPAYFALATEHARRAMGCHPEDMFSYYILGVSRLNEAQAGSPGAAAEAGALLEKALVRDPYYEPLVEAAARAAARRGDQRRAGELAGRLQAIAAVASGDRGPVGAAPSP